MYEYRATIIKIIDGDTVDVDIDLGFNVVLKDERVRIAGIDTPESRTRDLEEKKLDENVTEMETQNIERLITIISSNILMFKENIQNINAAQNISHQCVLHIDQMLPTIENSMTDSLAISAFLGKINNFKEY